MSEFQETRGGSWPPGLANGAGGVGKGLSFTEVALHSDGEPESLTLRTADFRAGPGHRWNGDQRSDWWEA